jgi:predicted O-methyltransferase YrrM
MWLEAKRLKKEMGGLLFAREVRYFYSLASRIGGGLYADLGTYNGLSTAALCAGLRDSGEEGFVLSFDSFEGTGLGEGTNKNKRTVEEVDARLKKLGLEGYYELVPGYFSDSVKSYVGPYDFIFIDGSHDYASAKEDFENWSPLLKVGGEIAFHDSTRNTAGTQVLRVMDEELATRPDKWLKHAQERTLTAWKKLS